MKIAVNTRLLVPTKMDGIARFTYETLQIICRQNPTVEFTFIFDRKVDRLLFDFPENVSFIHLSPQARHPILWYIWFEISLKRFLNKHSFDLFLSPEGWIPNKLKTKSLGVIHDLNFEHHPENIVYSHRKYLQHFFPKFAKRANRIATVSQYSKQDIVTTYGIKGEDIAVVYNGANSIFKPIEESENVLVQENLTNGKRYFLFVGTLHPRKNLEHLFLAYDEFRKESHEELKLVIVGNKKWWPTSLENIYQHLTYKDDIIFAGRQSDKELAQIMASATALTYLPYFEGFGIPILEAFQSATAVITSNVTSMPEVAKDAAILCNPRDTVEITKAMVEIASNTSLRDQLVEKGLKRAKDFSWNRSAQLLWESMQKTINA